LQGTAADSIESFGQGTNFVTKYTTDWHLESKAHKVCLGFAENDLIEDNDNLPEGESEQAQGHAKPQSTSSQAKPKVLEDISTNVEILIYLHAILWI
jgi:hypothetical protein